MPISVLCPGCKARFSVSEKFAGKKGPCPKCKVVITIPEALKEEIKVHAPEEFAGGGKDATGRAVLKPLTRIETKVQPLVIAGVVLTAVVLFSIAWLLRNKPDSVKGAAALAGLLLLAPALAYAGYTFLREEFGFYSGRALMIRSALCGAGYAALWGLYAPLGNSGVLTGDVWQWLFIVPVFVVIGGGIALACFDLDFGTGCLHFGFFLLVTLLLRVTLDIDIIPQAGEPPEAPPRLERSI